MRVCSLIMELEIVVVQYIWSRFTLISTDKHSDYIYILSLTFLLYFCTLFGSWENQTWKQTSSLWLDISQWWIVLYDFLFLSWKERWGYDFMVFFYIEIIRQTIMVTVAALLDTAPPWLFVICKFEENLCQNECLYMHNQTMLARIILLASLHQS